MAVLGKLAYELEITGNGVTEMEAWNKKIRDSVPNIQRFDKELSASEREMLEFAKKTKTGSQEVDKLNQKKLGKLKNEFSSLQKIAGAAGAGMLGNAFKNFMGQAASAANEYEQTVVSFKTMLGSADQANQVLKDLENFSLKTPFTPDEVNKSGRSLIAFGVAQDKLIPALNSIGDVASGLNIPFNELSDIYGKIKVQQTVYGEDLNQLGGRGVPIFTELAKVMGVNSNEIKKLASQGKISFAEVEKAFQGMSGEGGQFFNMMKEQSMTASGMISTMQGYFGVMQRSVGQAFMKMVKPLMEKVMPIMQKFVGWVASPQGLAILQILLPVIATLIGVVMVGSVYSLASAFGVLAIVTSPITLIILAIVAAVVAIYIAIDDFITYIKGGQSALGDFWEPFIAPIKWLLEQWEKGKAFFNLIFGGSDTKKIEMETSQKNAKLEKRAMGGHVFAGHSYLVGDGEGGTPELFVPSTAGNIINNSNTKKILNQSGARVTIAPTINIYGSENIRDKIKDVVNDMMLDARHQLGLGVL